MQKTIEPPTSLSSCVKLADGNVMPWLGLGVYRSPKGESTYQSVLYALQSGYRHIDTAAIYGNEEDVGRAIRDCGLPREEIFVTTKLWNADQGYETALQACDKSLKRLGLDYVNLYLLHWPVPQKRLESWRALIELRKAHKVRSIGVSNFMIPHLQEFFDHFEEKPVVNQVEFSPFLYLKDLLEFHRSHQIQLESYSPLTQGKKLDHPVVVHIAQKYQKTSAQILIRWALEHQIVVIPKSNKPQRISENAAVFDFSIAKPDLAALDQLNENLHVSWDPTHQI